jgi:hypothetical protein
MRKLFFVFTKPTYYINLSWGQFVEQKLMLSSNFRCDQIYQMVDMILITLCCAT